MRAVVERFDELVDVLDARHLAENEEPVFVEGLGLLFDVLLLGEEVEHGALGDGLAHVLILGLGGARTSSIWECRMVATASMMLSTLGDEMVLVRKAEEVELVRRTGCFDSIFICFVVNLLFILSHMENSERLLQTIMKHETDLLENIGLRVFLVTVVDLFDRETKFEVSQPLPHPLRWAKPRAFTSSATISPTVRRPASIPATRSTPPPAASSSTSSQPHNSCKKTPTPTRPPRGSGSSRSSCAEVGPHSSIHADNYSEREVRNHVGRLRELLQHPPLDQSPAYQSEQTLDEQMDHLRKQLSNEKKEASPPSSAPPTSPSTE